MDSGGNDIEGRKYKFVPPEGGWGYMITASVVITHITTIVPSYGFGLLYGDFLAATGDESNGTTLTNAAFLGVSSLTGLVSNYLFKKYTYRQVGMAGSIIFCVGSFGNIFVQNLGHLIITYGVIQGFGFGLILPSVLSAMNVYFDTKLNLMMGLSQTFIIISSMICPLIIAYVVEAFGFRRALIVLALYSLLNIPATAALQPVERHMKKIPVDVQQEDDDTDPRRELSKAVLQTQQMNLLGDNKEQKLLGKIDDQTEYFDLSLLKDPQYLNMVIGISLAFNADVNFIAVLRMILHNLNFEVSAISLAMTVHFCSDLVSRIIFSIISAMMSFRSRNVFLVGACLSAVFRIVFTLRDDFLWKIVSLGVLGFLRCFIQTTFPLVISEKYKDNFSTAFSLYMVVCGVVSMLFGPLLSYVKAFTQDDVMIIHVLTASYFICSFTWTIESLATKFYKRNDTTIIDL